MKTLHLIEINDASAADIVSQGSISANATDRTQHLARKSGFHLACRFESLLAHVRESSLDKSNVHLKMFALD